MTSWAFRIYASYKSFAGYDPHEAFLYLRQSRRVFLLQSLVKRDVGGILRHFGQDSNLSKLVALETPIHVCVLRY